MAIKLQIRRGLAADWTSSDPTLIVGEIGYETDTGNLKIGTGAAWTATGYVTSTLPQTTVSGTDINAAGYRNQGRYAIATTVTSNVPSGWTPASDAPGILLVTRIATGSVAQVLFSTKTQRVFFRGWDGSVYTTWAPLFPSDGSIGTPQLADDAVTADKLRDDASTDANRAVTTNHIRDDAVTADKLRDDPSVDANRAVTSNHIRDTAVTMAKIANSSVTYAKIQNVSATDKLLGRSTAGAGVVEEIDCTAAGRALLDDANAAAQRTTLGVVSLAEMSAPGTAANSIGVGSIFFGAESGQSTAGVSAGSSYTAVAVGTATGFKVAINAGNYLYAGNGAIAGTQALPTGSVVKCVGKAASTSGEFAVFIRTS